MPLEPCGPFHLNPSSASCGAHMGAHNPEFTNDPAVTENLAYSAIPHQLMNNTSSKHRLILLT